MPTATPVYNNDKHTVILTVEIPTSEYMPVVEKKLKDYRKKVQIKGFRTGEVPMNFLRSKFGTAMIAEEVQEIVDKELQAFLESSNLNTVAQPLPINKLTFNIMAPKDVKVELEIGFIPEFELEGISTDIKLPFYEVEVDDALLDEEVEHQRKRLSSDFEEDVTDIQKGDTIRVTLREAENGVAKVGGHTKEESYITLDKASASLQEKLLKAMVGEKVVCQITDLDTSMTAKRARRLFLDVTAYQTSTDEVEVEILEVKRMRKRELNQEFYKELFSQEDIEDYETFRDKLRTAVKESFNNAIYDIYHREMHDHLVEANKNMPLPLEFLRRFVAEQNKNKKVDEKDFQNLVEYLQWSLIVNNVCKKYNVEVTRQDVEYSMRMAIARYYGLQISPFHQIFDNQVEKMMSDRETYRKYFEEVQEGKFFAALEEEFGKEYKTVAAKDFNDVYKKHAEKNVEKEEAEEERLDQVLSESK